MAGVPGSRKTSAVRVLQIASEASPFAKTGGLADVAGALPPALERLGCDCTLVMPAYRQVFDSGVDLQPTTFAFDVPVGQRQLRVEILRSTLPGSRVPVYFVNNEACFGRPTLYGSGQDYPDNSERFILFARAAMELACRLELPFDVLHGHDWQAGLVPAYRSLLYHESPALAGAATIQTIHNMAYQGVFWNWDMLLTGIDWKYFNWRQMEFYGQLNFLKTGLVFADAITTVSPNYAREITQAPGGCGLEGVVASRAHVLSGIVNGIDTSVWNPQTDPLIPRHYSESDVAVGKDAARIALAARLGHAAPDSRPLVSFVGRLAEQKGVDILTDMLGRIARNGRAHYVILGTGDAGHEEALRRLAAAYPGTVDVVIGFDELLAHLIQAASDIVLMPSRFEPCGLSQLYAFRYGAIPVVRATGGLVDTVVDTTPESLADGTASGFVFSEFDSRALEQALDRALDTQANAATWQKLVTTVMQQDWSWDTSARKYLDLYEHVCSHSPASPRAV
jgi:starch synthase